MSGVQSVGSFTRPCTFEATFSDMYAAIFEPGHSPACHIRPSRCIGVLLALFPGGCGRMLFLLWLVNSGLLCSFRFGAFLGCFFDGEATENCARS